MYFYFFNVKDELLIFGLFKSNQFILVFEQLVFEFFELGLVLVVKEVTIKQRFFSVHSLKLHLVEDGVDVGLSFVVLYCRTSCYA